MLSCQFCFKVCACKEESERFLLRSFVRPSALHNIYIDWLADFNVPDGSLFSLLLNTFGLLVACDPIRIP